jgi:Raf kinase inhibitor-like YbhB/YbcL family protein
MTSPAILSVISPAFQNAGVIPVKFTADGENISPPIQWGNVPKETASLVLIAEDPDAPSPLFPLINWVHWVVYDIPPTVNELPEGLPNTPEAPIGIRQGLSSFKKFGYGGPAPPFGEHRYYFRVHALDFIPAFPNPKVTRKQVLNAIQGHVLAQGELMGRYRKAKK